MNIKDLLRENIRNLKPYSCARYEYSGSASAFLDANENPYNSPFNRYPDPLQKDLKKTISEIKNVPVENIFIGNGSDEAIDLLFRAFCEPGEDNVVAIEPTYGMYKVCADINNVQYRNVKLNDNFDIEAYKMIDAANAKTKIIWLCTPNNPTGNSLNRTEVHKLLKWFRGLVVIDEAYVDFSRGGSYASFINEYPNLVILQTMSKAWANAATRVGFVFASPEVINVLNSIKYPYNVSLQNQQHALDELRKVNQTQQWVNTILKQREWLLYELQKMNVVIKVYPTDANFVLVKVKDAAMVYKYLMSKGVIIRNRSNLALLDDCIRITVGTPEENKLLVQEMRKL